LHSLFLFWAQLLLTIRFNDFNWRASTQFWRSGWVQFPSTFLIWIWRLKISISLLSLWYHTIHMWIVVNKNFSTLLIVLILLTYLTCSFDASLLL
jgi:hypothetical protein